MAFRTPVSSSLTDAQSELTSKLGSMKGLLALPFKKLKNIPKDKQMSTFDYLLMILNLLGIPPEAIFRLFIEKVFNVADSFLEDTVLKAVADSADKKGVKFSSSQDNYSYLLGLKSLIPATTVQTLKQRMAHELTIMIFGPRDNKMATNLGISVTRVNQLIDQAVCASNFFTISNATQLRDEDVEFNRIKLRQQLEKGEVVYEISCQDVKIKLPEDPGFIFGPGGTQVIQGSSVSPAQSMSYLVQYVANQTQNINNQNNANSGGKTFWQILIEKLFNYITTLTIPYVGAIFSVLNTSTGQNYVVSDYAPSPCDMSRNDPPEKKEFSRSLVNALLKELLAGLLLVVIREFKKLIKNYFARTAQEKIRRKTEKIRLKFKIFSGVSDKATKATKFKTALNSLSSIIKI